MARCYRRAVQGADGLAAISDFARAYLKKRFGMDSQVVPVPVDMDRARITLDEREKPPVIFCAAVLNDPRKGAAVLMRAFNLLKRKRPEVKVRFAWTAPAAFKASLVAMVDPAWRNDVEFLETSTDIFKQYAVASVSVLPSLWETQGLVLLEALAAGTPVVGTRSGAIPDLICDSRIGRLFDPGEDTQFEPVNAEGLAEALEQALELSERPETAALCRAHAEQYGWDRLGPVWEALLCRTAGQPVPAAVAECAS